MTGIFIANTKGFWKFLTLSWWIKVCSYWYLKEFKQKHPDYSWMKLKDIPTHALVGYDEGLSGEKYIFESSKTQQVMPYYKSKYEFEFSCGNDYKIFAETVKESVGEWYGFLQLLWFVKTAVWMSPLFKWLVPFWGKLFHGGKYILHWGNPFPTHRICTETSVQHAGKYVDKYNYRVTAEELKRANYNSIIPLFHLDQLLNITKAKEMTLIIN